MQDESTLNGLREICPDLLVNAPMKERTTFRIGGPAQYLALPSSAEQISRLLLFARNAGLPVTLLGNCSNVLVRDGGIDGLVLQLGSNFSKASVTGNEVETEAGILMSTLAQVCTRAGLAGFEFASGIPGSLGGGVYMNAGAYNGEIGSIVKSVTVINERLELVTLSREEMGFAYRHTALSGRDVAVVSAVLSLWPDNPQDIAARVADFTRRRRERQPLNYPSAGSVFKRPEGAFAAALIDTAGLKGVSVGGAQVSCKHAGFFVNTGGATAADVLALIKLVQNTVYEKSGFRLEPEIKIIGHD